MDSSQSHGVVNTAEKSVYSILIMIASILNLVKHEIIILSQSKAAGSILAIARVAPLFTIFCPFSHLLLAPRAFLLFKLEGRVPPLLTFAACLRLSEPVAFGTLAQIDIVSI